MSYQLSAMPYELPAFHFRASFQHIGSEGCLFDLLYAETCRIYLKQSSGTEKSEGGYRLLLTEILKLHIKSRGDYA